MIDQPRKNQKVRVAAVGDLHAHKGHDREFRQLFLDVSEKADIVVLCGDLTNLGLPEEAEKLAADVSGLRIPVVAVLGNHDHHNDQVDEIKRILNRSGVIFLEDETFELHGVGFAGVKGFGGGFGNHLLSSFGEPITKLFVKEAVKEAMTLETALARLDSERIVVALHYSPVPETVQGESHEIFPFVGCSRLAETIDRFPISAVFHGHAHHGAYEGRTPKGVPVYNCSMHVLKKLNGQPFTIVEV